MGDERHHRIRLRAVYASRRRARLQVLDGLEAIEQVSEPEVGDLGFRGFAALAGPLCRAAWPPRFKPDVVARYDGTSDPVEFLQRYAADVCRCSGYRGIPVHLLLGPVIGPSSAQGRVNDPSYGEDPHEEAPREENDDGNG
jgi:hypothetical protein